MNLKSENIHPFSELLSRQSKEDLLVQRARVLWLTGLSGSGKSTIARGLEEALYKKGFLTAVLDGDNIRAGLNNNLGFSNEDREENIRRIAEVAKLFLQNGIITICAFVSPTEAMRTLAKSIIGEDDLVEIFVNTSFEDCRQRDVKGLYAKAQQGGIKDFTGVNAPYEIPAKPDLEIKTQNKSIAESVDEVLNYVFPKIRIPHSEIRNPS